MRRKTMVTNILISLLILSIILILTGCSTNSPYASTLNFSNVRIPADALKPFEPGQIIKGIKSYSGLEYLELANNEKNSVVAADNPFEKAVIEKAFSNIVNRIKSLNHEVPQETKLVIYDRTLSIVVPLDKTTLISGEQRLELYQYFLAAVLRAVEAGLNETEQVLDEQEKELLQTLIPNLSITFVNSKSDTLIFYPNGVFILNDEVIEKENRTLMDQKLNDFFGQ